MVRSSVFCVFVAGFGTCLVVDALTLGHLWRAAMNGILVVALLIMALLPTPALR